mmetsp:Transcript_88955/g.250527  ORF Transcript_88955/g.250527 Transcript_88955/m.250527 type:complete len:377 (-) Transcript_88955:60-1190(-)
MGGSCSVLNLVDPPSQSTGGLFICGVDALFDVQRLRSQGVRTILNMGEEEMHVRGDGDESGPLHELLKPFTVKHMNTDDHTGTETDLRPLFDEIADFVDQSRRRGGVVVHCRRGVNRSCSGCMAYLMIKQRRTCEAAFRMVHSVRPKVCPIGLFWWYLRDLERSLQQLRVRLQATPPPPPASQPPDTPQPCIDKRDGPNLPVEDVIRQLDAEAEALSAKDAVLDVFRSCKPAEGSALVMDREELGQVMEALSPGQWDAARMDVLVEAVNKNGDGRVDVKEFMAWVFGGDGDEQRVVRAQLRQRRDEASPTVPLFQRRSRAPSPAAVGHACPPGPSTRAARRTASPARASRPAAAVGRSAQPAVRRGAKGAAPQAVA